MMKRHSILVTLLAAHLLSACTTDTAHRYNGVSLAAGDAIAANTVLQMVDPWPAGVQQTDLQVPADQEQYRKAEPADDGGDGQGIISE